MMNNGDKPACKLSSFEHNASIHHLGSCSSCYTNKFIDFDQKENDRKEIATTAMQGIVTGIYSSAQSYVSFAREADKEGLSVYGLVARRATELADELLKQLES
jgi:hypothetical protein